MNRGFVTLGYMLRPFTFAGRVEQLPPVALRTRRARKARRGLQCLKQPFPAQRSSPPHFGPTPALTEFGCVSQCPHTAHRTDMRHSAWSACGFDSGGRFIVLPLELDQVYQSDTQFGLGSPLQGGRVRRPRCRHCLLLAIG